MGQYFCNPCSELHDDDLVPMVEENSCTEGRGGEIEPPPEPICANCEHWQPGKGRIVGGCDELLAQIGIDFRGYGGDAIDHGEISTGPNFGCNRFKSKEE